MLVELVLVAVLALLFYYQFVRPLNHFARMGVKQTNTALPIFGDRWGVELRLEKSYFDLIKRVYFSCDRDDRYVGLYNFTNPILFIRDPQLIKELFIKHFDSFNHRIPHIDPDSDPLWAANLTQIKGERWKEMRQSLSGSFTSSKMKFIFELLNKSCSQFAEHYASANGPTEVDMNDVSAMLTTDSIATSAYGIEVNSFKDPDNVFFMMSKNILNLTTFRSQIKVLLTTICPFLLRIFKVGLFDKIVTDHISKIIEDTITMREKTGFVRPDMINVLLETRKVAKTNTAEDNTMETGYATAKESTALDKQKVKKRPLTNFEIASQAFVFFFAGQSSNTTSITFTFYELAVNPDIQERLRADIKETHKKNGNKATYESVLGIKYLDMVVSESLRKWSPIVNFDRVCTKSFTIEPVRPGEKPIHMKPGDCIGAVPSCIQRDPKYFPNPDVFDPERFSEENIHKIVPYTFIPFGLGPRNCIGSRYALLQTKLAIYHILLNCKIVPTSRTPIPMKTGFNWFLLHPENGLYLALEPLKE
uniref:Cytochrome P450 CYP9T3 n=1 Tax=Ips pini TaxID=102803 RepID=M1JEK6_IPSPI|nr:cytochrome P450 CYP9T3 [Ips pini]